MSAPWFQRTYKSLLSGKRSSSRQEKIDRIIFQSLVTFLQNDFTFHNLLKLLECAALDLRVTIKARHRFPINSRKEAVEFFTYVLPKSERLVLDFFISSEEDGHAVTVLQDKGIFSLWDPNGFSFQSPNVDQFVDNFFRIVELIYPSSLDNNHHEVSLEVSVNGIHSIDNVLNIPSEIDPRYALPSTLPYNKGFSAKLWGPHPENGAYKVTIDAQPFKVVLECFPPHYSRASLTPFLLHILFAIPPGSDGSECSAEAVGNFCKKSYNLLAPPKRAREARKFCFQSIERFYNDVLGQLGNLANLSNTLEAFNIPEAKAIAEQFFRASFQRKTQLLDDYLAARARS